MLAACTTTTGPKKEAFTVSTATAIIFWYDHSVWDSQHDNNDNNNDIYVTHS